MEFNPNKDVLFEGNFSGRGLFAHISQKTHPILIYLNTVVKQPI